jgi:CRP-like cAMP-binding protein
MTYPTHFIAQTPLFKEIKPENINSMLACLSARIKVFPKETYVYSAGEAVPDVGILLSGSANIIKEDFWGNRSIIGKVDAGDMFAEAFSCAEADKLPLSVVTTERTEILFINCKKIITTCSTNCVFHNQLIHNMLFIWAHKSIVMMQKMEHTSCRTTRDKLLSYLSAQAIAAKDNSFTIPFDRQELADYLFVERSAMSATLSKLREEGVLTYQKNHFTLLEVHFIDISA